MDMCFSVQLFLTGSLVVVSIIGDQLVSLGRTDWQRAIADNATHGIIGVITWLIVSMALKQNSTDRYFEVVLCGLLASAIDLDHFAAARSLNLQDARQIPTRPFLHCTSATLGPCVVIIMTALLIKSPVLHRCAWLAIAAFTSHHTRDANRRGFWLWPCGSSPPVPYTLYVGSIAALPHMIIFAMRLTSPGATLKTTISVV